MTTYKYITDVNFTDHDGSLSYYTKQNTGATCDSQRHFELYYLSPKQTEILFDANDALRQIEQYIKDTTKFYNRNQMEIEVEDILVSSLDGVTPEEYVENNKHVLFFEGCDDGHFYMLFRSKIELEAYVGWFKNQAFYTLKEIFYPDDKVYNHMVFVKN